MSFFSSVASCLLSRFSGSARCLRILCHSLCRCRVLATRLYSARRVARPRRAGPERADSSTGSTGSGGGAGGGGGGSGGGSGCCGTTSATSTTGSRTGGGGGGGIGGGGGGGGTRTGGGGAPLPGSI